MGRRKTEGMSDQGSEAPGGQRDDLVGSYVGKGCSFPSGRVLLGKVASYDRGTRLFRVVYEDGEGEDLGLQQVRKILLADDGGSGMKMSCRKRKLDQLAPSVAVSLPNTRSRKNAQEVVPDGAQASSLNSRPGSDISEEADSSSDSCDYARVPASDDSPRDIQIPPLPPSSGDIGVPEESVAYLFSVYNFLRSFSLRLFLSPFGLHDFVGALNCTIENSLLDVIHVSLMRALRRHLELISLEGSELASKCLRHCNWSLLDNLTWPAFLVEYLYIMGYMKVLHEEGINVGASESEYYGLPVTTKLKVLQILCDAIIDSAELRTELEMRENLEEEIEYNVGASHPTESGPTRVHPRHSKTSAWKDIQTLESSAETNKPNPVPTVTEAGADGTDAPPDGNSDECRLCGMDGTLICCDGCPSAYHSRCIGLNKAFLPDGSWFCHECTVNKLGPTSSRIGRGTRGAEVFGLDAYGRLFMGTCNYLLVIGTSLNAESQSVSSYYNQDDVAKVLSVICSTGEDLSVYTDICREISKYWELPLPLVNTQIGKTESVRNPQVHKEPATDYAPLSITSAKSNDLNIYEGENHVDKIPESSADNKGIICQKDDYNGARVNDVASHDTPDKKTPEAAYGTSTPLNNVFTNGDATKAFQKTLLFIQTKSSEQHGTGSVVTDVSYLNQPVSAERSTVVDTATCASGNDSGICREDAGSSIFSKKNDSISASYVSKHGSHTYRENRTILSDKNSNVTAFFKPHAYANQYVLGDIAASAAANLAVLRSEESKVPEAHLSSNSRKAVAAEIALQMKAFSGAAMHFVWPNYEKKLVEVPRERCGWCFACKGASVNKKGCLLNLTAANSVKGFARSISSLRPIKHKEGHLPVIAAYIANMEESLSGLIIGPFLDADYSQQWRKQIREASSCRVLKSLLLKLEKNIRRIAFSGDWTKMVDDSPVESSAVLTSMSRAGPNQKHGSSGRRNKKQSTASKFVQLSDESGHDVQWWRGGKLSKVVFQKGALPSSLAKKAARQGGSRWIPGISYSECSELPRRNRQFLWRASVEMSKNAPQLALQVRYLDAYLRWRDLIRPDQTPLEGKGSDADTSAFRNAVVCDKKIAENKITYALIFANQKHLPLRVTKNILEAERADDENGKLWFSENHVPLYLIKEFEEKGGAKPLPLVTMLGSHCLTQSQKRPLKTGRRDIFSYLVHKWEPSKCLCASCQVEFLLRDAVRCSTCQGYCHKDCTIPSTVDKEDDLEFLFTCNSCYHAKSAALIKSREEVSSGQLSSQGEDRQSTGIKCILRVGSHQTAVGLHPTARAVIKMEVQSEMRSSDLGSNFERKAKRTGSRSSQTYGLKWKKKQDSSELGKDFRLENIILKSKEGIDPSKTPDCCLCKKPYCSDLMYIRCEECQRWFHADALNLEEAQIFYLVGFKCCRCRRIASPKCPYVDTNYRKPDVERDVERSKQRDAERFGGAVSKHKKSARSTAVVPQSKVDDLIVVHDDPLLHSWGRVEPEQALEIEYRPMSQEPSKKRNAERSERSISKLPRLAHSTNLVPNLKVEEMIAVGDDPLLHSLGRVEPTEQTLKIKVQPNGTGPVSQGPQKLSVRRPQSKLQISTDASYALGSEDPQNPLLSVSDSRIGTDGRGFPAIEEMTYGSASEDAQVGLDCSDAYGYRNGDFDISDFSYPSHDPEGGNIEYTEYEPQTYFSFTELLASEDEGVDTLFDLPIDPSDNCRPPTGTEDFGTAHEDFAAADDFNFGGVACDKCKLDEPPPDRTCEACGLRIHSHCSPWVESGGPVGGAQWSCGSCRDWR